MRRALILGAVIAIIVAVAVVTVLSAPQTGPSVGTVGAAGIEGTVILDGEPVAGMRVGIVSGTAGFPEISPETNDVGYYRIGSVPIGTFEVAVHDRQGNMMDLDTVVVRSGEISTLNFAILTGAVTGFVSLMDNLRAVGASVEVAGELSQPFFTVSGQVLKVNGADVQVFEYADSNAAKAEAGLVSPDGSSIGTTMVTWVSAPHFYQTSKLIVLYVGEDRAITSLLEAVLGPAFAQR